MSTKPVYKRNRFPVPRELTQLAKKFEGHASRKRMAEAIHGSAAHVGKLLAGVERVSPSMMERIRAALEGKSASSPDSRVSLTKTDPSSDPLVVQLLAKFDGSAHRARYAAGLSESHWYNLRRGARINDKTRYKIEQALNSPLSAFDIAGAALNPVEAPTIVLGGNGSRRVDKKPQKSKFDKTDPPLIKQLVQKIGSRSGAAAAIGFSSQEPINRISDGTREFTPELQAKVQAVLEGKPLPQAAGSDGLDRFTMGVALVICQGAPAFERVYDTATAMDLRWMFKVSKGALWIGFAKYPTTEKAATFKRVCMRDAVLIACP